MDKSEQYTEMRLAAIPDLGMGTPPQKPVHFWTETVWVDAKGDWYFSTADKVVQLERQDQLHEMIQFSGGIPNQLWNFKDFCFPNGYNFDKYTLSLKSMEQLWLAFVMKEKYGKVWNGKEWQ